MTEPKTTRSRQSWRVPDQITAALASQRQLQEQWQKEDGPENWVGSTDYHGKLWDLIFTQRDGRPVSNKTDRAAWKAFTAAHGVEGMRVHDARHTSATVLLELGIPARVVMDMMGWSQMGMLTRYQHVLDEVKDSVSERVAGALWGEENHPEADPDPEVVGGVFGCFQCPSSGLICRFRARKRTPLGCAPGGVLVLMACSLFRKPFAYLCLYQAVRCFSAVLVVPQEGVEPPTKRLEGSCSIH